MSSDTERKDLLEKTAKKVKKVKKGVDRKIDDYLDGTYDPKAVARKAGVRGAATSLVVLSLLTGLAFSNPADITQNQTGGPDFNQAPIVLDIDEFANAPVDDDDEDSDEQKAVKQSFRARFRQTILSLPQSVRMIFIVPLWAAGTAIMTLITFLWNTLFASPLAGFFASLFAGFAILLGLFTVTTKALFPDVPIRKILTKRNILILGCLALLLSVFDAAAPMYWHQYPLAAALLKLVLGGGVIGYLSHRIGKVFSLAGIKGLPPEAI